MGPRVGAAVEPLIGLGSERGLVGEEFCDAVVPSLFLEFENPHDCIRIAHGRRITATNHAIRDVERAL